MRIFTYIFLGLIIFIGVTFAILNPQPVTFDYWIAKRTLPLSLLVTLIFVGGFCLGLLMSGWFIIRARWKNRSLTQRLKMVEKEVQNLRTIPLRDEH